MPVQTSAAMGEEGRRITFPIPDHEDVGVVVPRPSDSHVPAGDISRDDGRQEAGTPHDDSLTQVCDQVSLSVPQVPETLEHPDMRRYCLGDGSHKHERVTNARRKIAIRKLRTCCTKQQRLMRMSFKRKKLK